METELFELLTALVQYFQDDDNEDDLSFFLFRVCYVQSLARRCASSVYWGDLEIACRVREFDDGVDSSGEGQMNGYGQVFRNAKGY